MAQKFKYLIQNIWGDAPTATNDDKVAVDHAESDNYYVINTETQEWLKVDGVTWVPIEAIETD